MSSKKNLLSALLGAALFALPIAASARDYRPHVQPNFAPRVNTYNRVAVAPTSPIMKVHDRDDWRWGHHHEWHHDRDDWRWKHDRDGAWRWNQRSYYAAPDYCRRPPYVNNYYRPNYYQPDSYNYATPYYGAPAGGGVAMLMQKRDYAVTQYQLAMRNGNRVRAQDIGNEIRHLNQQIADMRSRGYGYGYSNNGAINNPYANASSNGYGYGNGGLSSFVGPLLGNYIP